MLSRREFLQLGMYAFAFASPWPTAQPCSIVGEKRNVRELMRHDLNRLGAVMDVIIPEGDGMPSATAAGCVKYLENLSRQYPTILHEVGCFIDTLKEISSAKIQADFDSVSPDQGLQILKMLERKDASAFSGFVAYLYEAYYTRPQVLGLITCPDQLEEGESLDQLLTPVRRMKSLYREAQ